MTEGAISVLDKRRPDRCGGQGAGRCGSRLHGVASFLGLNTPSLWLRRSNATLFQSFNTGRDIPWNFQPSS